MSGLAYLIDALGGLAGGFAQNYNPVSNQADTDVGNALAALYGGSTGAGGGTGGSGPGGMGGGSYQYQGQSATDLPSASPQGNLGVGPLIQAQAPSQPKVAQAPAPGSPQGNAANGGNYGYSAPPQAQGGQGVPSLGAATNQPQPAPGGRTATPAATNLGRGPLTLESLVGAIRQHNPNISGRHLAAAVTKALPLLNAAGLEQYRQLGLQLREQNQENIEADRKDRSADRKQGMRDRLQMSADRIRAQSEQKQEGIKLSLQKLQQAKTLKEAQMHASDLRAAIKDKLEATNHEIQMQYNLTDEQKAELYKQAQEDAKTANANLDKLLTEKEKGKTDSENTQATGKGAEGKAPKVDNEQKSAWKKQAQETMAQHPEWADRIKAKYKELTGEDLGQ